MALRVGLGPVFAYEWLTTARRWQVYAVRALFVALLLAALAVVWRSELTHRTVVTFAGLAEVGQYFFFAIIGTQLVLILMAAPAATAGAICLDKARGTLAHLMITDLSDSEIVLGKLAARLIPALGLVLCSLPVMFLTTLLGGVDPEALFGAFLVTVGVAILGCSLALTISVWGRKTHEVLMATYLVWAVWLLANPTWYAMNTAGYLAVGPPDEFLNTNPFWLSFAPYTKPGSVHLLDDWTFLGGTLGISAVLAAVSTWRMRPVAVAQMGQGTEAPRRWTWLVGLKHSARPTSRWARKTDRLVGLRTGVRAWLDRLPSPSLDGNPVLWREWHRNRPSRWTRIGWAVYGLGATGFSLFAIASSGGPWGNGMAAWVNGLQVSIGLILLSVSASTSLAEERVRGSLDVLMSTPLPTRSIVWGKWWGTFRTVGLLSILPVLVGAATSMLGRDGPGFESLVNALLILGLVVAQGAAITSLGLSLATWVSRVGRAVALSVSAVVLMTIGWLFLVMVISRGPGNESEGLMGASPFFGVGNLTFLGSEGSGNSRWAGFAPWAFLWIVAYSVVSAYFMMTTLLSFDRRLGRMPEDGTSRRALWAKPKPILETVLE